MRRAWRRSAIAAMLVVVGAGFWYFGARARHETTARPSPAVPVTATTADAQDVPVYVEGLGTIQAFNMVAVKTRIDGQITDVMFKEGQEVKAGDPLFQIDQRPLKTALEQAQANKEKDEAQLKSAQLDLDRYAKLLPSGFQTRQQYDQQKGTVGQLQAATKADQAQIENAQINLDYSTIRAP